MAASIRGADMDEVYLLWTLLIGLLIFCAVVLAALKGITPRPRK